MAIYADSMVEPSPSDIAKKAFTRLGATFDDVEGCQMNTPMTRILEPLTRTL